MTVEHSRDYIYHLFDVAKKFEHDGNALQFQKDPTHTLNSSNVFNRGGLVPLFYPINSP